MSHVLYVAGWSFTIIGGIGLVISAYSWHRAAKKAAQPTPPSRGQMGWIESQPFTQML